MTKEMLFASMDGIDDSLLEESEAVVPKTALWKIIIPMAACMMIVLLGGLALMLRQSKSGIPEQTLPPPVNGNWTLNFYTDPLQGINTQVNSDVGYFEELGVKELEAVLPESWLFGKGKVGFTPKGELRIIWLELDTSLQYSTVYVEITEKKPWDYVVTPEEASVCNGVSFNAYMSKQKTGETSLSAKAQINGYWYVFKFVVRDADVEEGKAIFKQVLESFSYYAEPDKPRWEMITSKRNG